MLPSDRVLNPINGSIPPFTSSSFPPVPSNGVFLGSSYLDRSGSLSSHSDISLTSESSFISYTHDPHKKPGKKILRNPSDRRAEVKQKKSVRLNMEPMVSYYQDDDVWSVCSSEGSYIPPPNPYCHPSHHMGMFRDEDGRVVLLHQPWVNSGTSYKVSKQFTITQNIRDGVPVPQMTSSPVRKPFVDDNCFSEAESPKMSQKMLDVPKSFPDEISDTGSETGSEFSVEYKPEEKRFVDPGNNASPNLRNHPNAEDRMSDEIVWPPPPPPPSLYTPPPSFCPPPPPYAPSPSPTPQHPLNSDGVFNLPLSPVKWEQNDTTFLEDSNLELQKELAFKFPTPSKPTAPVTPNPSITEGSILPKQENLPIENVKSTRQPVPEEPNVCNSDTSSPSQEEEEIPVDSKLAAAVMIRDEEQKKKIIEARSKRRSLEMAETFYISGIDISQIHPQLGLQLEPTSSQTSLSDFEPGQPPSETQQKPSRKTSKDNGPLNDGKKRKDGLLSRFSLARLSGRGQHKVNQPPPSRTRNDPLPILPSGSPTPPSPSTLPCPEGDESHMYSQVDNATRLAIIQAATSPVNGDLAPYASIDILQAGMVAQTQPPQNTAQVRVGSTETTRPEESNSVQTHSNESGEFLSIPTQIVPTDDGLRLISKAAEHVICSADVHPGAGSNKQVGAVQVLSSVSVNSDVVSGVASKLQVSNQPEESKPQLTPNPDPTPNTSSSNTKVVNSENVRGTRGFAKNLSDSSLHNRAEFLNKLNQQLASSKISPSVRTATHNNSQQPPRHSPSGQVSANSTDVSSRRGAKSPEGSLRPPPPPRKSSLSSVLPLTSSNKSKPTAKTKPPVASKPESKPPVASKPESRPPVASKPESKPPVASKPESKPPVASKPESKPPVASKPELKPPVASKPESKHSEPGAKSQEKPLVKPKPSATPKPQNTTQPAPVASVPANGSDANNLYDKLSDFWDIPRSEEQQQVPSVSNHPVQSQEKSMAVKKGTGQISEPQVRTIQGNSLESTPHGTRKEGEQNGDGNRTPNTPAQVKQSGDSSHTPTAKVPTSQSRQQEPQHALNKPEARVTPDTKKTPSGGETQSLFLRKVMGGSDPTTIPHHLLVVGKTRGTASLPRLPSSQTKTITPDVDLELEELIRELENSEASSNSTAGNLASDSQALGT